MTVKRTLWYGVYILLLLTGLTASGWSDELPLEGKLITLDSALAQVLNDHVKVKLTQAKIEKEAALLRVAQMGALPKLSTEYSAALATQDGPGIGFWTTEIKLPLFQGGRRIHEVRKGRFGVEKEKLSADAMRRNVAFEVRTIYISLVRERELLALTSEWLEESRKLARIMLELYEKKLAKEEELLQVRRLFREARFEHVKHKESLDYFEALLLQLLNVGNSDRIEIEPLKAISRTKIDPTTFLPAFRGEHPLYRVNDLERLQAVEDKSILASERFPKISLTSRFRVARDSYLDQNRFEVGVVGSWDIWDFGVLGERLKAKEAEVKEREAAGQLEILELEREARGLISEVNASWEQVKLAEALFKEKKLRYQNERTRLIAEESNKIKLFDAFLELVRSRINLVNVVSESRILQARLASLQQETKSV